MAAPIETFPAAFRRRCRESADHVALREKRLGIWREHTWADYYDRARAVGLGLERIVSADPRGLRGYRAGRLRAFAEGERLGREAAQREPERFERLIDERALTDVPMLVYTSGTTGAPKGAMLSGANLAHAV